MFAGFLAERSKIEVSDQTHTLLARLAERYPLVVITNGNLDLTRAGLADYFTLVCKAGLGSRMKPAPDMFVEAQRALKLAPGQILHVGIIHRRMCWELGCTASRPPGSMSAASPGELQLLPDVELTALGELAELLL